MNLNQKYLDRKGYLREKNLITLKSNKYLKEGDIVSVADTGYFYDVVTEMSDIALQNNLFAKKRETSFINWIKQHISKLVTQSEDGHMRKEDKRKIDGIEENANNYSHPEGEGYNHIPSGGSIGMALMYSTPGTAKWVNLNDYYYTEAEVNKLLEQYSRTNHNHDNSYYKKIEIDEKLKSKLGIHETAKNSEKLSNAVASRNKDPNSVAQRDSAGDLLARLFRCDYPNENRIEGGIAFRVNENDNYIRFCNNKEAIREFLGAANGVQIYGNRNSGYAIFPGGYIEQWLYVTHRHNDRSIIKFPIPFPNDCLNIIIGRQEVLVAGGNDSEGIGALYNGRESFILRNDIRGSGFWMKACGY